jgi:hypothetical protein
VTPATICIPSNRPLATSKEFLESAIDYAGKCGMAVVISDNSGDPEKLAFFQNGPDYLTYLSDSPDDAPGNVLAALSAVTSDFVLMLGDDDRVAYREGAAPFDFSTLPADIVGVKPRIELIGADGGIMDVNDFTIDAEDAAARVIEYSRKMRGGNSTYYSFFRTKEFHDIYRLFVTHHPTRAGNSDFAIVYALLASGRLLHDPNTTIRYDNARWHYIGSAATAIDTILKTAGVPPEAQPYMLLFHFLDSYVLIFRNTSNLPLIERYRAAYAVTVMYLNRLLHRREQFPASFPLAGELFAPLEEALKADDPDLDRIFHIAGLIADRLKPGLKERYDNYLVAAAKG